MPLDFASRCRGLASNIFGQTAKKTLGARFASQANNFNLIRLVAALMVIYGHAGAITGHGPPDAFLEYFQYRFIGYAAVDIFFVTSGFLVTASALSGRPLSYFIASRTLRIYPALIVCVCLLVFVLGPLVSDAPRYWNRQTWSFFWMNATAYSNVLDLPGVFDQAVVHAVDGSLWSLCIEVRLYVCVLVAAVLGVFGRKVLFNALGVALLLAGWLRPSLYAPTLGAEQPVHVAMMFVVGSMLWMNRFHIPVRASLTVAIIAAALLTRGTDLFGYVYQVAVPYLVFAAAFAPGLRFFDRVGDYSYGVYLYGWPCQQLALMALGYASTNWQNTLFASAMALGLAMCSWHFVEKPAMRLKSRVRGPVVGRVGLEPTTKGL